MSATVMQTASLLSDFEEKEQNLVLEIVKSMHDGLREKRNREYLEKIERGIKQIAEGHGLIRNTIEVGDDD